MKPYLHIGVDRTGARILAELWCVQRRTCGAWPAISLESAHCVRYPKSVATCFAASL